MDPDGDNDRAQLAAIHEESNKTSEEQLINRPPLKTPLDNKKKAQSLDVRIEPSLDTARILPNNSFAGSKGKRRPNKASSRDSSGFNYAGGGGIASSSRLLPADHFSLCYGIIDYRGFKFLITDRPAKANIYSYVDELLKHDVKQLVRVCESEYPTGPIAESGIAVKDYLFQDGFPPPFEVYCKFLESVKEQVEKFPGTATAIHCVAGLGRAPVMVAIALIELGMNYLDAVEYIRSKRRGAINLKQLDFLESYKPTSILKPAKKRGSCVIS